MMPLLPLFIWFLITSIIMSYSASSLFFLWVCLEINMMSFIPLMFSKNLISMNSIMMYFLIQSFASSIYIFTISMSFLSPFPFYYMNILLTISMLIKLGAAPFHIWFPQVSEGLSFYSLAILMTFQKMIPLYIMSISKNNYMMIPIIFSAIIGSFGGFNQFSIRKILAFSSISHLAWIMTLQLINSNFWLIYLSIYSLIIMVIVMFINSYFTNFSNFSKKMKPESNFILIIMLLSLGGMPPTMGFIMKWMTLKIIMNSMIIMSIPLILSSLTNLFFYLRLIYSSMLKYTNFYKWEKNYSFKLMSIIIMQMMIIFLLTSFI
uniref:NADH dehydrogenase subunit 2 n=1 Tax=Alectorobius atacamensis TaxID=1826597 RepID=UPI00223830D0|nr:NADH dehydrogenase subunit 2 [Alectorobius atacamensis]UYB78184.1 NADH dehydrogenase subunit 2 [Alectorobius atacamensis]